MDGRLVQTDKSYSQLKQKQKEKISQWMFEETLPYYTEHGQMPKGRQLSDVIGGVYDRIRAAEIWIPFCEVEKKYRSRQNAICKRCERVCQTADTIMQEENKS